jgi:hypothetical protein
MSTATFNKLPDEPILILTLSGSSTDLSDPEQSHNQLHSFLDSISEPVFLILDMSNAQLGLDDLMRGASDAFRGDNPTFKHPNIREVLQVSDDPTLELAAEGMNSAVFGNIKIRLFETLEDALAYARAAR